MSLTINPAQGKILVSEPFLKDFYFKRSIVLLAEHNNDGTFGLVLNKPTDMKLSEIINDGNIHISEEFDGLENSFSLSHSISIKLSTFVEIVFR